MDYATMPYNELRALHSEVGRLLEQRRSEAVEQLQQQAEILGVTMKEIIPKKTRRKRVKDDDSV